MCNSMLVEIFCSSVKFEFEYQGGVADLGIISTKVEERPKIHEMKY